LRATRKRESARASLMKKTAGSGREKGKKARERGASESGRLRSIKGHLKERDERREGERATNFSGRVKNPIPRLKNQRSWSKENRPDLLI